MQLNIFGFRRTGFAAFLAAAVALVSLSGCDSLSNSEAVYPTNDSKRNNAPVGSKERDTVFGAGGLFGDKKKDQATGGGIGVNSFLWRASLDTLAFMPLASADPFGGVIITDWYAPAESPGERFKLTVFILDRQLRADGLKVAVFRQKQTANGWVDSPVAKKTVTDLENAILTRARELRVRQLGE